MRYIVTIRYGWTNQYRNEDDAKTWREVQAANREQAIELALAAWRAEPGIFGLTRLDLHGVSTCSDDDRCAAFEAALLAPDHSHVSTRAQFGGTAHAYRRDATSPSGVRLQESLDLSLAEPILKRLRRTAHFGPQRGEVALAKQAGTWRD